VRNFESFKTSLNFEPPAFETTARYPKSETKYNAAMIALCLGQVWWSRVHAPLRKLCQFCLTP